MRATFFLLLTGLCGAYGCASSQPPPARFVRSVEWAETGIWLKADTHVHTQFSDGGEPLAAVVDRAVLHGCEVLAITDHADSGLAATSDEYFEALAEARRKHPQLILLAGLEWNVPPWKGREHATLLVPPDVPERELLRRFQSQFDDWGRSGHNPELAHEALRWLEANHRSPLGAPLVIYNHPHRKRAAGESLVEELSGLRRAGSLLIGLEGGPGHQDYDPLGAYSGSRATIDRWDPAVAEVGGAWDQLLARGTSVWGAIATSDFHAADPDRVPAGPLARLYGTSAATPEDGKRRLYDFWPGEFAETWLYAPSADAAGALAALRAGTFFAAHGHIVREVQLQVFAAGLARPAIAGEAIEAPQDAYLDVVLQIDIPLRDWQDEPNRIDELELIGISSGAAGLLGSDPRDGGSSPAAVIARQAAAGGAMRVPLRVPAGGITLRARGRRVVAGDAPDLLFYSNPIEVRVIGEAAVFATAPAVAPSATDPARESAGRQLPAWIVLLFVIVGSVVASLVDRWRIEVLRRFFPQKLPPQPAEYAVPRAWRRYFLVLLLGCIFLAVYGSLVPLAPADMDWATAVTRFRGLLREPIVFGSRSDWVVNVLLFVPIGFLATGLIFGASPSDRRRGLGLVAVVVVCGALSVAIEFSQLFVEGRVSSQNDVVAETLGSLIGASGWLAFGPPLLAWLGRAMEAGRPRERVEHLLEAYVALVLLYMILPLDLTVRPAELYDKWQEGKINLVPFGDIADAEALIGQFGDFLLLVPLGALAAIWRWPDANRIRPLVSSLGLSLVALAAIESAQLLVYSRFSSTTDLFTGLAAVAIGWHLARWLPQASRRSLIVLAATHALLIVAVLCLPFDHLASPAEAQQRLHDLLTRLPFAAILQGAELHALSEMLRKSLLFAGFGGLLALVLHGDRSPARSLLAAGLLGAALALTIEILQVFLPGRTCELTDVLLATVAAAIAKGTGIFNRAR